MGWWDVLSFTCSSIAILMVLWGVVWLGRQSKLNLKRKSRNSKLEFKRVVIDFFKPSVGKAILFLILLLLSFLTIDYRQYSVLGVQFLEFLFRLIYRSIGNVINPFGVGLSNLFSNLHYLLLTGCLLYSYSCLIFYAYNSVETKKLKIIRKPLFWISITITALLIIILILVGVGLNTTFAAN